MRLRWLLPIVIPALLLTACSGGADPAQARLCRLVLPALHEPGSAIRVLSETPGTAPRTVRITYRIDGQAVRTTCAFLPGEGPPDADALIMVMTDGEALSSVRLHILKRWWLGAFGVAESAVPAPPDQLSGAGPEVPGAVAFALQQGINALAVCGIYALLALAYSLIYGLTGRIVLAFGEIAITGGYGAMLGAGGMVALGLSQPLWRAAGALGAGLALALIFALASARLVIAPLAAYRGQAMIVATLGLAIALQEYLRIFQGQDVLWLALPKPPPFGVAHSWDGFAVTVSAGQIAVACISAAAIAAVLILMRRSRFGRSWHAVADDAGAAALLGIDARGVLFGSMALAGALAGLAGWIFAVHYGMVGFAGGLMIGLKALAAAVIGGIGSSGGAVLAAVLLGLLETLWTAYAGGGFRDIAVLSLLVIALVLRPRGFFGFETPFPRRIW